MKSPSASLPVHVHIPGSKSVHVHLEKSSTGPPCQINASHLKPIASLKIRAPWIPPGKSSRRKEHKRERSEHCLQIKPESATDTPPPLRLTDLSSEEEDERRANGNVPQYERRVESLMSEVDGIQHEVKLRQAENHLKQQSHELTACRRLINQQEERLQEASKDLWRSKQENFDLRSAVSGAQSESAQHRLEAGPFPQEIETLLRKLVEVEIDGRAAAKQLMVLKEATQKLKKSKTYTAQLSRQHEQLEQKFGQYEETNRSLRHLLIKQHGRETDMLRMSDERQMLIRKLADSEAEKRSLEAKLNKKEKEVDEMVENLETEKDHHKATGKLSKVLESTRSHLQSQLNKREAENNHLESQVHRLEERLQLQQDEVQEVLEQMKDLKQHCDRDRHVLENKRKEADKSLTMVTKLTAQLQEKEAQLAQVFSTAEDLEEQNSKQSRERSQLELMISTSTNRITELAKELRSCEEKSCSEKEELLGRLHSLTAENMATKLENQRLTTTLATSEDKLAFSQSEVEQLKDSFKNFESLVDGYKSQLQKSRRETEEYSLRLELIEKEAQSEREDVEREVDLGRKQLQSRLKEIEMLREALRRSEGELRDLRGDMLIPKRSAEPNSSLSDIKVKLDQQSCKIENLQEKNLFLQEENQQLKRSFESTDRKIKEMSSQNRDLLQVLAKREETIHSTQLRLEEKCGECDFVFRQLEQARAETQRQVDHGLERDLTKTLDLENQLSLAKSDLDQLRRSKDDMERRLECKIQDLKNQLEQANSTNRTLQNYVHLLKISYTSVFGDSDKLI